MSKHFFSIKTIKKQILSVNNSIESYFNKIKYFKSNYKKILLNKEYRVFWGVGVVALLTLTYFLMPTFYSKNYIQSEIKNQIFKNYNINLKFNDEINYGLLPKPHFYTKNLSIVKNGKEIGNTEILKVFIGLKNLFSIDNNSMKDLIFYKTEFNLYSEDLIFFQNLLKIEPNENEIKFKKSNIFLRNNNDELLFIHKINNSRFYYDSKNLQNVLTSNSEIFNVPIKINVKNDKFNKKFFTKFNSKKIRLDIENITNYENENKKGLLDILFISKNTSLNYEIKKDSLNYLSKNESYKGRIDFKPFYFTAEFNYDGLSFKNFLRNDSIVMDLIHSEIFNNKNLNLDLVFNIKDIVNVDELNNLILKIGIEQGIISPSNSSIMWKDDLKIQLRDSIVIYDQENLNLIGNVFIDIKDINDFYKSFQVKKNDRKEIKTIEFDFNYDLNKRKITLDNFRIDNKSNEKIEKFISDVNSKEKIFLNKIKFKNFVSNFFSIYSG